MRSKRSVSIHGTLVARVLCVASRLVSPSSCFRTLFRFFVFSFFCFFGSRKIRKFLICCAHRTAHTCFCSGTGFGNGYIPTNRDINTHAKAAFKQFGGCAKFQSLTGISVAGCTLDTPLIKDNLDYMCGNAGVNVPCNSGNGQCSSKAACDAWSGSLLFGTAQCKPFPSGVACCSKNAAALGDDVSPVNPTTPDDPAEPDQPSQPATLPTIDNPNNKQYVGDECKGVAVSWRICTPMRTGVV
jgi:hypothetical protein